LTVFSNVNLEHGLRRKREALPALKTVNVNLEDGLRKKREALPALKTVNVKTIF
jgi:hypothetical protein